MSSPEIRQRDLAITKIISDNIILHMGRQEMRTTQLARLASSNPQTIGHILRATRVPSVALVVRIADALGVTVQELITKAP